MTIDQTKPPNEFPELFTLKQAANKIGIQYRALLEAVNQGAVPHYRLNKSRRLVDPSEVLNVMKCDGGDHD